ncbi:uncharacterized protein THITE_2049423 [Thermothielavioides terrestris NRRL 8126]|uniref:Uncharacterized protein n=1 Tax=Thermothielavioides terrestris (strain ATCC 38088 / NRRL 8126) TaxID=578455 RepID=G2R7D7_THETT|nr:uncharacterized protein THITE_2049423 [Thermothielavioides terrestris NRRL 8126]AEO67846.1 hypothetical protein THITE_2049423 [Thermothielavioides terrestris NRRL 8126]
MTDTQQTAAPQFVPRFRSDVYPFISPSKFRGSLKDKVAIITGTAGAIGQALAESFAVAGAKLVLTYNKTVPPPALTERCLRFGAGAVEFVQCDVAQLEGCEALVRKTLDLHGRVDILVNNAGANGLGPMYAQDPRDFIHDMAVNFHGPYYLMRLVVPEFRRQRSGCVLNIASRAGTVAIPYSTSYCASKAALINLTACVQKEMDVEGLDDVHLYALHPGGIKSAMTLKKYAADSISALPPPARASFANTLDVYNDSPYLNGMVCVALAAGVAKRALRGRYFDVGQDLEDVLAQEAALAADPDLYALHTRFLGGLANGGVPPGGYRGAEEGAWEFPGF